METVEVSYFQYLGATVSKDGETQQSMEEHHRLLNQVQAIQISGARHHAIIRYMGTRNGL